MTAAATPRGRPQYAALRDEIASSASGDRKTSSRNQTATAGRASRRHPRRREPGSLRSPALPLAATRINKLRLALTARLGDSFYFARCEIVESLLRRGARNLERTALRPGWPRLRRGGAPIGRFTGHPAAKTVSVRALAELSQTTESCLANFLLQQSPAGISTDFAHAKRVKSHLKRAGDRRCSATSSDCAPTRGRVPAVGWQNFVLLGPFG